MATKQVNKKGFVYLLKSPTGFWKIGKTIDPKDRIATFSVKLPFEVSYVHLIPCYDHHKLESELHIVFSHLQVDGEWFKLSPADIAWITSLTNQTDFDLRTKEINQHSAEILSQYRHNLKFVVTKIEIIQLMFLCFSAGVFSILLAASGVDKYVAILGLAFSLWSLYRNRLLRSVLSSPTINNKE